MPIFNCSVKFCGFNLILIYPFFLTNFLHELVVKYDTIPKNYLKAQMSVIFQ